MQHIEPDGRLVARYRIHLGDDAVFRQLVGFDDAAAILHIAGYNCKPLFTEHMARLDIFFDEVRFCQIAVQLGRHTADGGLGRIDSPQPLVFFLIEREKPERKQGHHKCEQEDHCGQDDVPAGKFFECHCSFPPVPVFSFYPIIRNPGAKVNHPPRKFTKVCNNGKSPVVSTNHRAFSWRSRRDLNPRAVV